MAPRRAGQLGRAPKEPPWGSVCRPLERALLRACRGEPVVDICGAGGPGIGDDGARELASAILQQSRLVSLRLRCSDVGDLGACTLAKALQKHKCLTHLDLADNVIGEVGAGQLVQLLLHTSVLRVLRLQGNRIADAGALHVSTLLGHQLSLQELHLGSNAITALGASHLSSAVGLHSGVQNLKLSDNALLDAGALSIANALLANESLTVLHLDQTDIGDSGASELALALEQHSGLQELHLNANLIGNEGAGKLAAALERHVNLRALMLEGNRISDTVALEFVLAITRMPRRDVVCSLAGNPVKRLDSASLVNLEIPARTVKSLSQRGMRLKHMLTFWKEGIGSGAIAAESMTTAEAVQTLVQQEMRRYHVSYAEFHHDPAAEAYIVHAETGLFRDLIQAIASHATNHPCPSLDPDHLLYLQNPAALERSYYIDAFAVNQNIDLAPGNPRCQTDKLDLVLAEVGRRGGIVLVVVDPNYSAMTCLSCLVEVHCAMQLGLSIEISFGAMQPFPRRLRGGQVRDATVLKPGDREWLLTIVDNQKGDRYAFDLAVREALETRICERYAEIFVTLPKPMQDELAWSEAQDNARANLVVAVAGTSIKSLTRCIDYALEVRIEQVSIKPGLQRRAVLMLAAAAACKSEALQRSAEESQRVLASAHKRFLEPEHETHEEAVVAQLSTAMAGTHKPAVGWGGPLSATQLAAEALRSAVLDAVEADVDAEKLLTSQQRLAELEVLLACRAEDIGAMQHMTMMASRLGVKGGIMQAARKRLAQMQLAAALTEGNSGLLLRAIVLGEEVGSDDPNLDAARGKLEELYPQLKHLPALVHSLSWIIPFLETDEAARLATVNTWIKPHFKGEVLTLLQRAIEALRQAIEMATEAELVEESVHFVRKELAEVEAEAYKRGMRAKLSIACRGEDANALRSGIISAEEAGVEDILMAVARRRLAELDLKRATTASDSYELQQAVLCAKREGVREASIENALVNLKGLDFDAYRSIVSEDLKASSTAEDRLLLRRRIVSAEEAMLEDAMVMPARMRLAELDVRAAAAEDSSAAALRTVLNVAENLGVSCESLSNARRELARRDVLERTSGSDIEKLECAITAAEELGIDKGTLTPAVRRLAELKLKAAIRGSNIPALHDAVSRAAELSLEAELLAEARKRLVELELNAATRGDNPERLRRAVSAAVDIGLSGRPMAVAKKRLALLELQAATAGESPKLLRAALSTATEFSVEQEHVRLAERRLIILELEEAAAGEDGHVLARAIASAKEAALDDKDIAIAKSKLAALDPEAFEELALEELVVASKGSDAEAIHRALDQATRAGVAADELEPAQRHLAELLISAAPGSSDGEFIQHAINMAIQFSLQEVVESDEEGKSVARWPLEAARGRLEKLKLEARQQAASARLLAAMQGDDMKELTDAIAEAQETGVDNNAIIAAKSSLA